MRHPIIALALTTLLTACGASSQDTADRRTAERTATQVRDAATSLVPAIARAVKAADPQSADGRYVICGMEPSPTGVAYTAEASIPQADVVGADQTRSVSAALDSAGWKVDPGPTPAINATKDDLTARVTPGGAVTVQVRSACVDAPQSTIDSLTDRDLDPIDLP